MSNQTPIILGNFPAADQIPAIDPLVFNVQRAYGGQKSLFLEGSRGLLDSINILNQEIWDLYDKMRLLDWNEKEFPLTSCIADFKTCSKSIYEIMIMTLAWQWEGDSLAAHNLVPVTAPFISDSGLWSLTGRIGDNENLHALTYSNIIRGSFENPDEAMAAVLEEAEAYKRMDMVAQIFSDTLKVSTGLMSGQIQRTDPIARDAIILFYFALLCLERIQFMASFAITFAICDTGLFMPIGKYVQKICNDEYNVHVPSVKAILRHELKLPEGYSSYLRQKDKIQQVINEVTQAEVTWTRHIFSEGRELVGSDVNQILDWVYFAGTDVATFANIQANFPRVERNPLPYMNDWIDINRNQPSPQEEKTGNYLLGGVEDTAADTVYDLDF